MGAAKSNVFAEWARQYRDLGFNPVPIRPGSQSPTPTGWQVGRQNDEAFQLWLEQYSNHGLGLLCGTPLAGILTGGAEELRGQLLIAVDVDTDDLVEPVRHALRVHPKDLCAKHGAKGMTFLARGDTEMKNRKLRRHEGQEMKTLVEILAAGSQTVIPPTIHPKTGEPYRWVGTDIVNANMSALPKLSESVMDEIASLAEGGERSTHFDALRTMVWTGVDGGGNTHDVCVAAVASMVARQWSDRAIHERIEFAKREACLRANMPYDWPASARVTGEWIESARKKGMDEPAEKKATQARILAMWLIGQLGGREHCASLGRGILHYRDGYWPEASADQRELEHMVLGRFQGAHIQSAEAAVKTAIRLVWRRSFGHTEAARHLVCTRSGVLDARTLQLERWAPEHELLHQVRADWNPDAACPQYDAFVSGVFGGDTTKIDTLEEFFGWTFVQDTGFHKALYIVGRSRIGKSTLTDLLCEIHDASASSHVKMSDLSAPRERAKLMGRLVNTSPEQDKVRPVAEAEFKRIASADIISGQLLFKDLFDFRPFVRLINTVEHMPEMTNVSEGLAQRLIILECAGVPLAEDKRKSYHVFLCELAEERDGIFSRWMRALNRLIQRGRFTISDEIRADIAEYIEESAGLTMRWLRECCAPTRHPRDYASNGALWHAYHAWALRHASSETHRHTSIITWGKDMKRLGYPAVNARRGHEYIKARKLMLKRLASTRDGEPGY